MASIEEQTANQIANIERASGRSLAEWMALVQSSGNEKHGQIVAWLKSEHGLTHGNANLLALKARETAQGGATSSADVVDAHYAGRNEALRPLYDRVVAATHEFGSDIELAPKKTYVSLRRKKQFATGTRGRQPRSLREPTRRAADGPAQADQRHGHAQGSLDRRG